MDRQILLNVSFIFIMISAALFATCNSFTGFGGDSPGSFKIIKAIDSPDGKYSATFWLGMGGGAAGWCGKSINIHKKEETLDLSKIEENRRNRIFDVGCSSDVEINWEDANLLRVVFSIGKDATSATMNSQTEDGKVKISYEIK